jgi:CBS domain-containing protein
MVKSESFGDRLTKETTVSQALDDAGSEPLIVREDTALRDVAAELARHPAVRVVCVVDAQGTLRGLLRAGSVCDDLFFHVAPEEFISDILEPGKLEEYRRYARGRVASDLMEEAASVVSEDTLGTAFKRLHERGLDGLPVIDAKGRPISFLDRLRLIVVWLQTHPPAGSP